MFKNILGQDSPIPKFRHLKIRRRDGAESLTTFEEGVFKVPIDSCKTGQMLAIFVVNSTDFVHPTFA